MTKQNLDDVLKEFEEKANNAVSSNRKLWKDTNNDNIYEVDIHIWRKPGMGNSIQTIAGNKISIMTATASYLTTLLLKEVCTEKELDELINMVKEGYKLCSQKKN